MYLLWSLLPNDNTHVFLHCPLIIFVMIKLYLINFLPWLVLARAEKGSYPELKIKIVGPRPLYSLEISIACVHD